MSTVKVPASFADLSREDLAILVPELLLCGHLIDRSGMPHLIGAFGREGMTQVAIEEWMASSPSTRGGCNARWDSRATGS